jgi:hypothetical protein
MLLEPDISMILKEANMDKDTRKRFSCAMKPSPFSIKKEVYKNTVSDNSDDEPKSTPRPKNTKTNLAKNFSSVSAQA